MINIISGFKSLCNSSQKNFATKMQASSTQKTKDSAGRRLGVKKFGGHEVFPGDILVRQRGFKWHQGNNTVSGKDHTITSISEGKVRFERHPQRKKTYIVHVDHLENPNRLSRPPAPYVYHPELFPERAQFNPEPTNLVVNKKSRNIKKTYVQLGQICKTNNSIIINEKFFENHTTKQFLSYQEQIKNLYQQFEESIHQKD